MVETATFHPISQSKYPITRCPDPATLFSKPLFCCLWVSGSSLSLLPSLHMARLALLDSLTLVELSLPPSGHRNPVALSSMFSFLLCSSCKGLAVFPGSEKHWHALTDRESLVCFMLSDRAQDSIDRLSVNRMSIDLVSARGKVGTCFSGTYSPQHGTCERRGHTSS